MISLYIKKQKELYKSIKTCFCPALKENVYFTSSGLNHLLYYRRRPRKPEEKHYRASLISYIIEVVKKSTNITKSIKSNDPLVTTWGLESEVTEKDGNQSLIKVILVKSGNGRLSFLSVMRKRIIKNKNPQSF